MNLDRRSFLVLSAGVLAAPVLARRARAWHLLQPVSGETGETWFDWRNPVKGVHVAFKEGGNVLVLVGQGESVVVDSKNGGFGAALRREADALGAPVKTLINTHHHADHTGGNAAFSSGCAVIAHAKAKPRIGAQAQSYVGSARGALRQVGQSPTVQGKAVKADLEAFLKDTPGAAAFEPTRTVDIAPGGKEALTLGGVAIELHHVGSGHTDNDVFVVAPSLNVVHCGDLFFHRVWPFYDPPAGANTPGWIRSLQAIQSVCDNKTLVIPGHGELTDKKAIQGQIDFMNDITEQARAAVKAGTSREDFSKTAPEKYKDYAAGDWIRPITLGAVFDEATKAK